MTTHKELLVWKKTQELLSMTYQFTRLLPKDERYVLVPQMRRSALSVLSNIAEGAARGSTKDYCRFLYISLGSISELEAQYEACIKLELAHKDDDLADKIDHVKSLLIRLIKVLRQKSST